MLHPLALLRSRTTVVRSGMSPEHGMVEERLLLLAKKELLKSAKFVLKLVRDQFIAAYCSSKWKNITHPKVVEAA